MSPANLSKLVDEWAKKSAQLARLSHCNCQSFFKPSDVAYKVKALRNRLSLTIGSWLSIIAPTSNYDLIDHSANVAYFGNCQVG